MTNACSDTVHAGNIVRIPQKGKTTSSKISTHSRGGGGMHYPAALPCPHLGDYEKAATDLRPAGGPACSTSNPFRPKQHYFRIFYSTQFGIKLFAVFQKLKPGFYGSPKMFKGASGPILLPRICEGGAAVIMTGPPHWEGLNEKGRCSPSPAGGLGNSWISTRTPRSSTSSWRSAHGASSNASARRASGLGVPPRADCDKFEVWLNKSSKKFELILNPATPLIRNPLLSNCYRGLSMHGGCLFYSFSMLILCLYMGLASSM